MNRNRAENTIVGSIDRRRERECTRDARTARSKHLAARALSVVTCELGEIPEGERPDHAEHLCAAVRQHLVKLHGEASAAAILSREAHEAARNLLPKAGAREAAERLFQPANDREAK